MLLEARFEDGTGFPRDEVRSELTAVMFAGFEATAAVLAWTVGLGATTSADCSEGSAALVPIAPSRAFGRGDEVGAQSSSSFCF